MHGRTDELRQIAIRGPLLVDPTSHAIHVPAPRDCVVFGDASKQVFIRPLRPWLAPESVRWDGALGRDLQPLVLDDEPVTRGKPMSNVSSWWSWGSFASWLASPISCQSDSLDTLLPGALGALPMESRVHVAIGAQGTAEEGKLFQTSGLRFANRQGKPLAIGVQVDPGVVFTGRELSEGHGPFAGERRLVRWTKAEASWPALPSEVSTYLGQGGETVRVRVVLLTPAIFAEGWKPGREAGQLLFARAGVRARLVAAVVPRPETISGWDFATQRPKATRRMVSAGSVFWLDLSGTPKERLQWANDVWMSNVSDDPQDRRDGFGLAAVGVAS